jgi:hypothetical protein
LKLLDKPPSKGGSILSIALGNKDERLAAGIICKLGQHQTADILGLQTSDLLFRKLIAELPLKAFSALGNDQITQLFQHTDDTCRKAGVLKAILALPKSRLKVLMATYLDGEQSRFYNVIHWLDFGLSVESDIAKRSAKKTLASI